MNKDPAADKKCGGVQPPKNKSDADFHETFLRPIDKRKDLIVSIHITYI